jgi:glutamate-1-semialdehyde aminotransferase
MVELKIVVSDVDYEAVIRALTGGGVAGTAAVMAARALSDTKKEELAVKYLNGSAAKLGRALENLAASKGIRLKIAGAQAKVL